MRNIFRLHPRRTGFTLIELIVVVAIIALLAAAAFVAINPAKRVGNAADAKRWSDVTAIADAISHYAVDNNGSLPSSVSSASAGTTYLVAVAGDGTGTSKCCDALGACTYAKRDVSSGITPTYIPTMPIDPDVTATIANSSSTAYYIIKDSAGRIKIGACFESDYATASIVVQR